MGEKTPSIVRLLLFAICSYAVTIIAIVIGFVCQFVYWLLFDSFGRREKRSQRKFQHANEFLDDDEFYAVIIGAGFSGIGSAIKLRKLGTKNFIILERNGHIGGTWYANTYPGCACDVPSNLYSYSFEPNPRWSYFFSRQPEIQNYIEHCAKKYDICRHIQFKTNVNELRWIEEKNLWQITTCSNEKEKTLFARFVIAGSGPLSNASYPKDIPGLDQFRGDLFHTARWQNDVELRNKRVAVIGTGASAIQVVPAIQQMNLEKLFVFQRTPPWTIPRVDRKVTEFEKMLFTWFPSLQQAIRRGLYWSREALVLSFGYRWPLRFVNETLVRHHLRTQVKDERLREKVTPTWELGCKRVLITSDWYPALQKPNVQLVTDRIREVRSNSIVTIDGDEYPVDIIILATGFETQKFSIPTFGIAGCSLLDQWAETMQVNYFSNKLNFSFFFSFR